MKKIPLSQGQFCLIDDADFPALSKHRWSFNPRGSAIRWDGERKQFVALHREILNAPRDMCVDHINGDKRDNRKNNLRLCTHSQNSANRTHPPQGRSGYYGVYWHEGKQKWQARVMKDYRDFSVGYFKEARDAALARDVKAVELFGEFATLNFPEGK